MELKEGMYVKYTRGAINGYVPPRIGKIIEKINDSEFLKIDSNCVILESDIAKVSYNIIDLIEVGDYVNGHPVTLICEDEVHPQNKCLRIYGRGYVWQKGIKSIVTKEQFKYMSYRVEEQ